MSSQLAETATLPTVGRSAVYTHTADGALLWTLLDRRRPTMLGALVSIAVMRTVVVLNYAYDVPVERRVDETRFLVTTRGFHRVNGYPLDR